MEPAKQRLVEIRLLVVATVEINHAEFIALVRERHLPTVGQLVSAEVISNLESLPYMGTVVAVEL